MKYTVRVRPLENNKEPSALLYILLADQKAILGNPWAGYNNTVQYQIETTHNIDRILAMIPNILWWEHVPPDEEIL